MFPVPFCAVEVPVAACVLIFSVGFEQTLDERDLLENLEELHYQVEMMLSCYVHETGDCLTVYIGLMIFGSWSTKLSMRLEIDFGLRVFGSLNTKLRLIDCPDWLEGLRELDHQVERIERIQNLPERIAAIGQKFHDHWVTVSLAFSTMYATVSGKVQDQAVSVKAKMIDQAVSVKAKMIGVKDKLKERLSPQKVRPNDDQPEDEPIAIPLATDFSP
ncbi:hypothetical protein CFC21_000669 [Triticum aestivum]|uniref:Uncharacterized protein n=3 Tax=Triticum TaxID=4564 RepID=A0A9R0URR6_TRITD|nr:hypothetical protein TRIUR3_30006 [Triticum urartu]KAF6982249.1 hypothetical protein CFC21_000669 [Triticum aestivum]VAH01432.1 unnamed protein product [Triticum turgidum subsp. durum]